MHSAIGLNVWSPAVIGDFTEKDARLFLQWELNRKMSTTNKIIITVQDSQWEKVFQVMILPFMQQSMFNDKYSSWPLGNDKLA